ncbi:MAG TPA: hypothetical protein VLA66_02070 [Thermoanaerobaculia bacterium]|nr:hypothetical protein [Thermoanaerobaculia bacterium]
MREIAATCASPWAARLLVLAFALVALSGIWSELSPGLRAETASWPRETIVWPRSAELRAGWRANGWEGVNWQLRRSIGSFNRYFERDAVVSRLLRPPIQRALLRLFRYGNGQVVAGTEDDWLVYQIDLFHTVGPPFLAPETIERRSRSDWRLHPARQPDPLSGLRRLKHQLRRLGIQLVFMPTPSKLEVYPRRLASGSWREPPRNPSFETLVEELERGGIPVYDPTRELFELGRDRDDLYLEGDTHWSPAGLQLVAEGLARFLERRTELPPHPPVGFLRRPARIEERLDLLGLLGFPRSAPGRESAIEVVQVLWPDGRQIRVDREPADVVLLGDSFSMVYSRLAQRGVSAGFAEHLAAALDRPVHAIARNRGNILAQRSAWLRERPEVLAQARVVVYEVAVRLLSTGDWAPGRLPRTLKSARVASVPETGRREQP